MPILLLELAGLICLVVAGAFLHPALAFGVAGLGLLGKSFELEGAARRRKAPGAGAGGRSMNHGDVSPRALAMTDTRAWP